MALISLACYDTVANNRTRFTRETLNSLLKTVDFHKHRIVIIDNGSCEETQNVLINFAQECEAQGKRENGSCVQIISLPENIGTARAINKAWQLREPNESCVKMDNDVVIHESGWLDIMEKCVEKGIEIKGKRVEIGIIGLKRKDLMEYPNNPDPLWRSELHMIPHERGENWVVVESVGHVIGTCQLYSSALLDKIGYLYQPGIYGFDDVLAAYRASAVGFCSVFIPHIEIDHIDPGGDAYTDEKRAYVQQYVREIHIRGKEYVDGERPVWEDAS